MKNLITLTSIIVFSIIAIASSKDNSNVNNSEDSNDLCIIHNKDCNKYASEMGMSIDEYHRWQAQQIELTELEDEMLQEPNYKCQWCSDEFTRGGRHMDGVGDFCSRKCVEEYRISESFK